MIQHIYDRIKSHYAGTITEHSRDILSHVLTRTASCPSGAKKKKWIPIGSMFQIGGVKMGTV